MIPRADLRQKYNTEWFDKKITKSEKEMLEDLRTNYHELCELCDDFDQHQW